MRSQYLAAWRSLWAVTLTAGASISALAADTPQSSESAGKHAVAHDQPIGALETVATFDGPMLTGVTVSHTGRIFVNFPRWGDDVQFTVAEVKDGRAVAYPNALINRTGGTPADTLVAVQSVVVDPSDRLWAVDTGSIEFKPSVEDGPKLVGVDLATNEVFKKIVFSRDVVPAESYLNDIRFDLTRGKAGMAFITDSGEKGPSGIVVVDLASGKAWRHLARHPSTQAVPKFLPIVEGQALLVREAGKPSEHLAMAADGIAISHDGKQLYYCPLASRNLYRVSIDALANPDATEDEVAKTVEDLGDKGGGADGLESDAEGRIYLSNYEHNAILSRSVDGQYETLVHDPRVLWPDTMSLATNGYLYFTANQLHRQQRFHDGKDLREKPYLLLRVKVDAKPVLLK